MPNIRQFIELFKQVAYLQFLIAKAVCLGIVFKFILNLGYFLKGSNSLSPSDVYLVIMNEERLKFVVFPPFIQVNQTIAFDLPNFLSKPNFFAFKACVLLDLMAEFCQKMC